MIGCVYIYPATGGDADAEVRSWVRAADAGLDVPLWRAVTRWIGEAFPFERVQYADRPGA